MRLLPLRSAAIGLLGDCTASSAIHGRPVRVHGALLEHGAPWTDSEALQSESGRAGSWGAESDLTRFLLYMRRPYLHQVRLCHQPLAIGGLAGCKKVEISTSSSQAL